MTTVPCPERSLRINSGMGNASDFAGIPANPAPSASTPGLAWAIAVMLAAGSGTIHAQDPGIEALRGIPETYENLASFSVSMKLTEGYRDDFLKYREVAGYPLDIRWPTNSAEVSYFALGEMFRYDLKRHWGDGTPTEDNAGAWDGRNWQRLRRESPSGSALQIARERNGRHEVNAQMGNPFAYGLRFLLAATPRAEDGWYPEDNHEWVVTLDRLRDGKLWEALIQRIQGNVELVGFEGRACWKIRVDAGVAKGDRSSQIFYDVWLPMDAPAFPLRLEARTREGGFLLGRVDVEEFFEPVVFENGASLRFPKTFRSEIYTSDPNWRGKVVKESRFEFHDLRVNLPLTQDDFKIDPSLARRVDNLDTGQTILLKDR